MIRMRQNQYLRNTLKS